MIPPHLDFRLLKRVVSIEHLLRSHGVLSQMRCHGQRLIGPCPVHRGDNPNAFSVDLERQLWYCFTGCQRGGDVVDLVRLMSGGDYRQTAEELARLARIAPPLERHYHLHASSSPHAPSSPLSDASPWIPMPLSCGTRASSQTQREHSRPVRGIDLASSHIASAFDFMMSLANPLDTQDDGWTPMP